MGKSTTSRAAADKYRSIFEHTAVSLWEEDISGLRVLLKQWRSHAADLREHLRAHPALVRKGVRAVTAVDVNEATLQLYEAKSKTDLLGPLDMTLDSDAIGDFIELFVAIAEGRTRVELESSTHTLSGKSINLLIRAFIPAEGDPYPYMLVTAVDFTDYKRLEKSLH